MYGVGWPSVQFERNVKREANRVNAEIGDHVGMRNVLFAVTTKCPLQCEHCFEWKNLNLPEKMSAGDLRKTVRKLIDYGVGQIHFSGGEPMMRNDDILPILNDFNGQAGFWIITSGYGVTIERAFALKQAGLTGMSISLDHFDEYLHNKFRNYRNSYQQVKNAIVNCRTVGLVTNLSICVTKEFLSSTNLEAYLELAKELGVSFIQLLEPKAVGHYEGRDVQLNGSERKVLVDFFIRTQQENQYKKYPIVLYHEYFKEKVGCRGGGNGTFYIDPLGGVHACPFCRHSVGNIVHDSIHECVERLWKTGCGLTKSLQENSTIKEVAITQ